MTLHLGTDVGDWEEIIGALYSMVSYLFISLVNNTTLSFAIKPQADTNILIFYKSWNE